MRRGRRHDHRRARRGGGEDRPDVRAVQARRAGAVPRGEARIRSGDAAQPRQGRSHARALCRVRPHARARRQAAASRAAAVLTLEALQDRIVEAAGRKAPLRLRGGGSKDFYGNEPCGEVLDTRSHGGIVSEEATELVVPAKAGTPLIDLETILKPNRDSLPFEPPPFAPGGPL